jgi:hypothetical protein
MVLQVYYCNSWTRLDIEALFGRLRLFFSCLRSGVHPKKTFIGIELL